MTRRSIDSSSSAEDQRQQQRVWHADEEQLLGRWDDMCKAYSWMHEEAEKRAGILRYAVFAPILLANAVAASVSFVSTQNDCESTYGRALEATAAIVNIVAGGLVVLEGALNLSEIRQRHHECATLFSRISRLIQSELSIPRRRRLMDGDDFVRMISFDVDRIINMDVSIPESVKKRFHASYDCDKRQDSFDIFLSAVVVTPSPS